MRRIEASYALVRPVNGNTWRESAGSFHPRSLEVSGRVSRNDGWSARNADKVSGSERPYRHRHHLRSSLGSIVQAMIPGIQGDDHLEHRFFPCMELYR